MFAEYSALTLAIDPPQSDENVAHAACDGLIFYANDLSKRRKGHDAR